MASKATLENELRTAFIDKLKQMIEKEYETDSLPVSASEITLPVVDSEGNEKFLLVKVSVPRGTRNGNGGYDPYDGYAASEEYLLEQASKAQEKAVKKAMKEAEKAKPKKKDQPVVEEE